MSESPNLYSAPSVESESLPPEKKKWLTEDWTAVVLGISVLLIAFIGSWFAKPTDLQWNTNENPDAKVTWTSPFKGYVLSDLQKWVSNPFDAFIDAKDKANPSDDQSLLGPLLGAFIATILVGFFASLLRGGRPAKFLIAFPVVFALAVAAYVMAGQKVINNYSLEYALWALLLGFIIANSIGTPDWLRPAVLGELYIKIGLVLYGGEVLFGRLLALGIPGIFVSWVVTPIVLIATYLFGQHVLKIKSKSLNMVVSADMSVCGVSAAIATAAACKAKKEELSLAIGLSLSFTVIMMVIMPRVVLALGMDPVVGGAWIGGTIDATGAVAAAGEALGEKGSETAVTIKMIQNILIGVIAFGVAVYWTKWVEPKEGVESQDRPKIGIGEVWKRFPKFVLGFIAASIVCSILFAASYFGELWVDSATKGLTKPIRGWLFCLAFISLGLDTNFKQLLPYFRTGKPAVLYICGQTLNIVLTLAMAYLMFGVIFKQ